MKIKVLGCFGSNTRGSQVTSFLLNDSILLDAGCAASGLTLKAQAKVDTILLSHAHLDHIADLPFLCINRDLDQPLHIYTIPEVIGSLQLHILNDDIWPDFTRIPSPEKALMRFHPVTPGRPFRVKNLKVTAVRVNHIVPTVGFFLNDSSGTVLYTGDTGPTEDLWRKARRVSDLRSIILEVSFPNRMRKVAELSKHLTPDLMGEELSKIDGLDVPIYLYHLKPQYKAEITREIGRLTERPVRFLVQGRSYSF